MIAIKIFFLAYLHLIFSAVIPERAPEREVATGSFLAYGGVVERVAIDLEAKVQDLVATFKHLQARAEPASSDIDFEALTTPISMSVPWARRSEANIEDIEITPTVPWARSVPSTAVIDAEPLSASVPWARSESNTEDVDITATVPWARFKRATEDIDDVPEAPFVRHEAVDMSAQTTSCCLGPDSATGPNSAPSPSSILTSILWLQAIPSLCWVGGNECVTMSCTNNSAVVFCNSNPKSVWTGCPDLGNMARTIYDQCQKDGKICGKASNLGYSVSVQKQTC